MRAGVGPSSPRRRSPSSASSRDTGSGPKLLTTGRGPTLPAAATQLICSRPAGKREAMAGTARPASSGTLYLVVVAVASVLRPWRAKRFHTRATGSGPSHYSGPCQSLQCTLSGLNTILQPACPLITLAVTRVSPVARALATFSVETRICCVHSIVRCNV